MHAGADQVLINKTGGRMIRRAGLCGVSVVV